MNVINDEEMTHDSDASMGYIVVLKQARRNQICCNMKHLKDAVTRGQKRLFFSRRKKKSKHCGATEPSFRVMAMTKKSKSTYFHEDSIS